MDNNEKDENLILIENMKKKKFLQNNLLYYYFKFDIIIDESKTDFNFLKSKIPEIVDKYSIFDEQIYEDDKISLPYSTTKEFSDFKCITDNKKNIISKIFIYDSSNYIKSFEFSGKNSEIFITFFLDWIKTEKKNNLFHCFYQPSKIQSELFINAFIYWELVDKILDKNNRPINKTKVAKNFTVVTKEPCFSLTNKIFKNLYEKYSLNKKKIKLLEFRYEQFCLDLKTFFEQLNIKEGATNIISSKNKIINEYYLYKNNLLQICDINLLYFFKLFSLDEILYLISEFIKKKNFFILSNRIDIFFPIFYIIRLLSFPFYFLSGYYEFKHFELKENDYSSAFLANKFFYILSGKDNSQEYEKIIQEICKKSEKKTNFIKIFFSKEIKTEKKFCDFLNENNEKKTTDFNKFDIENNIFEKSFKFKYNDIYQNLKEQINNITKRENINEFNSFFDIDEKDQKNFLKKNLEIQILFFKIMSYFLLTLNPFLKNKIENIEKIDKKEELVYSLDFNLNNYVTNDIKDDKEEISNKLYPILNAVNNLNFMVIYVRELVNLNHKFPFKKLKLEKILELEFEKNNQININKINFNRASMINLDYKPIINNDDDDDDDYEKEKVEENENENVFDNENNENNVFKTNDFLNKKFNDFFGQQFSLYNYSFLSESYCEIYMYKLLYDIGFYNLKENNEDKKEKKKDEKNEKKEEKKKKKKNKKEIQKKKDFILNINKFNKNYLILLAQSLYIFVNGVFILNENILNQPFLESNVNKILDFYMEKVFTILEKTKGLFGLFNFAINILKNIILTNEYLFKNYANKYFQTLNKYEVITPFLFEKFYEEANNNKFSLNNIKANNNNNIIALYLQCKNNHMFKNNSEIIINREKFEFYCVFCKEILNIRLITINGTEEYNIYSPKIVFNNIFNFLLELKEITLIKKIYKDYNTELYKNWKNDVIMLYFYGNFLSDILFE